MVEYKNERRVSAVNIGCRPTLTNDRRPTIEVHILDFDHDLYGQQLEVELWKYIRPEQKFPGVDELTAQIAKDCSVVKEFFCELTTYN
jgi:riboflavin kinase/FMN adenylyltransferase